MDTLELNKIAFGVLGAGLLLMLINEVGNAVVHPEQLEKSVLAIDTGAVEGTGTADKEEEVGPSLAELMPEADPAKGEKVAKKCAACHTFDKGGANKIGPNLYGVLGRAKAAHEGFGYSSALAELGGDWGYTELSEFIANPKGFAKGTKMAFAGIRKPEDRADLLAYMRQQSDSPLPLPTE